MKSSINNDIIRGDHNGYFFKKLHKKSNYVIMKICKLDYPPKINSFKIVRFDKQ